VKDPVTVREDNILRVFIWRDEIRDELGGNFEDLSIGLCENHFYGIYEKAWIGTGLRRGV
jgi:hypothetical protein